MDHVDRGHGSTQAFYKALCIEICFIGNKHEKGTKNSIAMTREIGKL